MEYIIIIALVVIIFQLAQLIKNTNNTYHSIAILNQNIRTILTGLSLLLDKEKEKKYWQIERQMTEESNKYSDKLQ